MRKVIVDKNNKLINFVKSKFNNVPESALYKALRQKDIRINDVKVSENLPVSIGDEITIYIKDEILLGSNMKLNADSIVYDDENIVIIKKPQGILVQGNENEIGLDKLVCEYFDSKDIVPCHRLDRNTSGLIIFAKDSESEKIILDLIKNHLITKIYRCLVYGHPKRQKAELNDFLFKDSKVSNVIISSEKKKGYVPITTRYSVIKNNSDNTSLLEVELVTGRTHQIRAHLAFIGHPIIGDGKYGINQVNKKFKKTWQELEAYKIIFKDAYGKLEYLKNKSFV